MFSDFAKQWKAANPFFRQKLFIFVGWTALVCLTATVACPRSQEIPPVRLSAVPNSRPTRYSITNQSGEHWRDVRVTVNGRYQTVIAELAPSETLTLSPSLLSDLNGKAAPESLDVLTVEILSRSERHVLTP